MDFEFGRYIHRVHPNKIFRILKILEKRERGRIQRVPNVFKYPLLSQQRVKLYELQIFYARSWDRSEKKSVKNFAKSSLRRTQ